MISIGLAVATCLVGSVSASALRLARRGLYTPSATLEMLSLGAGVIAPPIAIYLIWPLASWWSLAIYVLPSAIGAFWAGGFVARERDPEKRADRVLFLLMTASTITLLCLFLLNMRLSK
ncbi:MAG: hypothetical protein ACOY5R_06670 [Pseudomonadota bacterium]